MEVQHHRGYGHGFELAPVLTHACCVELPCSACQRQLHAARTGEHPVLPPGSSPRAGSTCLAVMPVGGCRRRRLSTGHALATVSVEHALLGRPQLVKGCGGDEFPANSQQVSGMDTGHSRFTYLQAACHKEQQPHYLWLTANSSKPDAAAQLELITANSKNDA